LAIHQIISAKAGFKCKAMIFYQLKLKTEPQRREGAKILLGIRNFLNMN
jgi:hypothetical protein